MKTIKLAALFPIAVTKTIVGYEEDMDANRNPKYDSDGNVKMKPIIERAIDKNMLMQDIFTRVVEGHEERRQFPLLPFQGIFESLIKTASISHISFGDCELQKSLCF